MMCAFCEAERAKPCHVTKDALACKHCPKGSVLQAMLALQANIAAGYVADLGDGQYRKVKAGSAGSGCHRPV